MAKQEQEDLGFSFLGHYVHLTGTGYLKHGITEKGDNSPWSSQHEIIKGKVKQLTSKRSKDLQSLEDALNGMAEKLDPAKTTYDKKFQEQILGYMQEEFGSSLQNIDWGTLDVTAKNKYGGVGRVVRKRNSRNQNILSPEQVNRKIIQLQNIAQKMENLQSPTKKDQLLRAIEEIKVLANDLTITVQTDLQGRGFSIEENFSKETLNQMNHLWQRLNEVIATYAAAPAVALQKGELFEFLVTAAPQVAANRAIDAANEIVNEAIKVGGDRTSVSFEPIKQMINDSAVAKELPNGFFEETITTQDKVDVIISWNGSTFNSSLKNVNIGSVKTNIHLVSGTNLLTMLQGWVDTSFLAHFANLYAHHYERDDQGVLHKDDNGISPVDRGAMSLEMGLVLLYKALTGEGSSLTSADVFIINDNSGSSQRPIKVLDVGDLLEKIGETLLLHSVQINGKAFLHKNGAAGAGDLLFSNRIEKTPTQRVAMLLSELRAAKVNVTLNNGIFRG